MGGCSPGPGSTGEERGRGVVPSKQGERSPLLMGGSDIFKVTLRTYYTIQRSIMSLRGVLVALWDCTEDDLSVVPC